MSSELNGVELPNRDGGTYAREELKALDRDGSRSDAPETLLLDEIEENPNLFQPRLDSIAYAPGRSEAHVAALAKTARRKLPLDPVWVLAFGNKWFLIDGHHRLQAYRAAGWEGGIPVNALLTELRGNERIEWGIQMSFADNKKDRLSISATDKSDGAWRAVAAGNLSKAETITHYNVAEGTVASMRRVCNDLLKLNCPAKYMARLGWQGAKAELRKRQDGDEARKSSDFAERKRRDLARRLKGTMDLRPTATELAAALEAYSPGIIAEMAIAHSREHGEE